MRSCLSVSIAAGAPHRTRDHKEHVGRKTARTACGLIVAAVTLAVAVPTGAATPSKCLEMTTATGLRTSAILTGLDLSGQQTRELRSRLAMYHSVRGFPGVDGLGLSPTVRREVLRRIAVQVAAMNAHPLGWPCDPFENQTRVVAWVKARLIANGFRPNVSVTGTSPRQLQINGIQDGVEMYGAVAKSGPHTIVIGLNSVSPRWGRTYTFDVGFKA